MSTQAPVRPRMSARLWRPWLVFSGVVLGAVGLNLLVLHSGGFADGWPMYTILGGLGGGILMRVLFGAAEKGA
jgi:hypothetical protein